MATNACSEFSSNYEIVEFIAAGCYGKVYRCKSRSGKEFAVKEVLSTNYKAEYEMRILQLASDDENIITYFDWMEHQQGTYKMLIMECCHGTVEEYVHNKENVRNQNLLPRQYFDDITPLIVMKQSVCGINFLHSNCGIIHRDIKPSNLLLVKTRSGTKVKVTDFGLSRIIEGEESGVFSTTSGPDGYTAPECRDKRQKIRKSSDIYSLGIVFYFVLTNGEYLFQDDDPSYRHLKPTEIGPINGLCYEQRITACDVIKRMVMQKQSERLLIQHVAAHPVFWTSKEKVEFYKRINNYLQQSRGHDFNETLNNYDGTLLQDGNNSVVPFEINLKNVPQPVIDHHKKKDRQLSCENVKELVRLIRNMDAHVQDVSFSKKVKRCLGFNPATNTMNWDKFLQSLTGEYPQLLVHLYELVESPFKNKSKKERPSPKKNTSKAGTSSASLSHNEPSVHQNPTIGLEAKKLRDLLKKYNATESDMVKYVLRVFYDKKQVLSKTVSLENECKVFYIKGQGVSPKKAKTSNQVTFPVPPIQNHKNLNTILNSFQGGMTLRFWESTLLIKRDCDSQIFAFRPADKVGTSVKVEKQQEELLFSYHDFARQVFDTKCSSVPSAKITMAIGTHPDTQVEAFVKLVIVPELADKIVSDIRAARLAV